MYTPAAAKRDPVYVLQHPKQVAGFSFLFPENRKKKVVAKGDEGPGRPAVLLGVTEAPPDVSREADHQHLAGSSKQHNISIHTSQ
jgi:hypothetical protein